MKLSIRLRIILWFLLSTFFILSLTATLVFFISNSVMRRTTKNYFISAVEEWNLGYILLMGAFFTGKTR